MILATGEEVHNMCELIDRLLDERRIEGGDKVGKKTAPQ